MAWDRWMRRPEPWMVLLAAVYPFVPVLDLLAEGVLGHGLRLERHFLSVFIFSMLALATNLQVGAAGLLQLGIAAFFGVGAYGCGILTVDKYPFHMGFWGALGLAPAVAAVLGLALGVPTARLRGDYLALVTLGFGEVVRVVLLNAESITDGSRGLNPLPAPWLPAPWVAFVEGAHGGDLTQSGRAAFLALYYVALLVLVAMVVVQATLQRGALGRALGALREDEIACASVGISPARVRLGVFAASAAMAGIAGVLYATHLTTTAEPNTYDFNCSVMVLCAVIIGGLGSLCGAIAGTAILLTFDNVVAPILTRALQDAVPAGSSNVLLTFGNWRWLLFGTVLVLMMRLRPQGLWPQRAA